MSRSREGSVLVVEDDPDLLTAVADVLTEEGFPTAEANNGTEALEYLRSHPRPALILLDWGMEPMTGGEVLSAIREEFTLAAVPVVLMTAARRIDRRKLNLAGLLYKPFGAEELSRLVHRLCG